MTTARIVSLMAAAFLCSCGPPSKKAADGDNNKPVRSEKGAGASVANVSGTWTGEVSETGVKDPYPVKVAVTCLDEGKFCGTTTYPQHKCGGRLLYYGVAKDETGADGEQLEEMFDNSAKVYTFTEILSYGEEHCADRGRLLLTPGAEDTVGFSWIDARDADHRATATLRRSK